MKKFIKILLVCVVLFLTISVSYAETGDLDYAQEESEIIEADEIVETDESKMLQYYQLMDEKADRTINSIMSTIEISLVVVGILATLVLGFGIVLAFKTPKEIERKMDKQDEIMQKINEKTEIINKDIEIINNKTKEIDDKINELNCLSDEAKQAAKKANEEAENAKFFVDLLDAIHSNNTSVDDISDEIRIEQLKSVINKYPRRYETYVRKAHVLIKMSRNKTPENKKELLEEAIIDFNTALEHGFNLAYYHICLGIIYYELGLYEKSIDSYNDSLKINKDSATAHNNISNSYFMLYNEETNPDKKENYLQLWEEHILKALKIDKNYILAKEGYERLLKYKESIGRL
jgi:tetratricopeptide (TPR) repeat protein